MMLLETTARMKPPDWGGRDGRSSDLPMECARSTFAANGCGTLTLKLSGGITATVGRSLVV